MSENKVFALIVDGDVFGTLHLGPEAPNYDRMVAGLSSSPIVVDASSVPNVQFGWTFDGTSFNPPAE